LRENADNVRRCWTGCTESLLALILVFIAFTLFRSVSRYALSHLTWKVLPDSGDPKPFGRHVTSVEGEGSVFTLRLLA
jgi:hypothetical protein